MAPQVVQTSTYTFDLKVNYYREQSLAALEAYKRLRDLTHCSVLLEGAFATEYAGRSYDLIGIDPIASISIYGRSVIVEYPDGVYHNKLSPDCSDVLSSLHGFMEAITYNKPTRCPHAPCSSTTETAFPLPAFFGFIGYDANTLLERGIKVHSKTTRYRDTTDPFTPPDIAFVLFRHNLFCDRESGDITIISLNSENLRAAVSTSSIINAMRSNRSLDLPFSVAGYETSDCLNDQFLAAINVAQSHLQRGDIFQVVLSRTFSLPYRGDDFPVYVELRRHNPHQYQFFLDMGSFRLFGSSPEIHLELAQQLATVSPIAGTTARTGRNNTSEEIRALLNNAKECAEHTMLVDLARNDLSKLCSGVEVTEFMEPRFYPHVAHLVSKVTGTLADYDNVFELIGATFPAGTLSGAPKIRAMELIAELEHSKRGPYGGCVGFIQPCDEGFRLKQAIVIRSVLSSAHQLTYRAGAGIVADSDPQKELEEIDHKLRGIRSAIQAAISGVDDETHLDYR